MDGLKTASRYGLKYTYGKTDIERPFGERKKTRNSIAVTFSRSLRSLERKDLIFLYGSNPMKEIRGINVFADVVNIKSIAITDEGIIKAKELLNVKNEKVNNKAKLRNSDGVGKLSNDVRKVSRCDTIKLAI